jgi:hypothetical protein
VLKSEDPPLEADSTDSIGQVFQLALAFYGFFFFIHFSFSFSTMYEQVQLA